MLQRFGSALILWLDGVKPCISCKFSFHSGLFKYEKTTSAVYVVKNCVDTLLHLLQVYQQKPGDKVAEKSAGIFTRTCCLLAVLFNTEPFASVSTDQSPFS